jgi:sarcosine oxidase, subunit alpha
MSSIGLTFEGRSIEIESGDTVASALFRAGVRTFTRSLKYHRRRGLCCLTGDCPNCFVNVDGEPAVRACCTRAEAGMTVRREGGWPNVDRDFLAVNDHLHWALPVGFYYKTFLRPRWAWPQAERLIRRLTGLGTVDLARPRVNREQVHHHPGLLVVGAGVAGLAAALAASESDERVVICDAGTIGQFVGSPATLRRLRELELEVRKNTSITLLEQAAAAGIYEGPLIPASAPEALHLIHPRRVVVATGAVDFHPPMIGNDLPGVFLARGAALLATRHRLAVGSNVVAVGAGDELAETAQSLRDLGVTVTALPSDAVERIEGRSGVEAVVGAAGRIRCDAVLFSLGREPRDSLLRQGTGLPVTGVGEVVSPGCSLERAEFEARETVAGAGVRRVERRVESAPNLRGCVCLCEDVTADELELAWREGFRSPELLKRYTTVTMGSCQGLLCQRHLLGFVAARADGAPVAATTSRPPAATLTLEDAAAGLSDEHMMHTALHEHHLSAGATMEPTGGWLRPSHYGDVEAEYLAVRERVSVMDVGTLGKFLVGGKDALAFLEQLYPTRVATIRPGRLRYGLLLAPSGFVIDDGTICALEDGTFYLTFTSVGAAAAESILRDWADAWGADVHIVNLTVARGAINVAGPRARELLQGVTDSESISNDSLPYLHHRELDIAGVRCRVIRLGFVGELSFELHHRSRESVRLWDTLTDAGSAHGLRPHGLEALRLLRLEKGHVMIGQDTDFDTTPAKLGMDWAVKLDKDRFVGKAGLLRAATQPMTRRLAAIAFEGTRAPLEGSALTVDGRYVGHLSSSRYSPVLGHGVALGWTDRVGEGFPNRVEADGVAGNVISHAFYDPDGKRLRA